MSNTTQKKNYNNMSKKETPVIKEEVEVTSENEVVKEIVKVSKENKFGKVSGCELLNVRDKASTNSDVLATLASGTSVEITGSEGNFYKIKMGKNSAFVMKNYITL